MTSINFESLSSFEDSVITLLESGPTGFSDSLVSITNSPTYQYLVRNFWYAPETEAKWLPLFKKAAIISRILRMQSSTSRVVTILGESGTGKELLAEAFAAGRKFVAINCTSLPDQLLESELFGHVSGAFTGALRDKDGLLVEARNGVAFLDEIGDMPPNLQAKLLRVIQNRTVRPVGSNKEQPIQCVIVCASNQDLRQTLRNDLFWRLTTFILELPSLRDRLDEIDWLIRCRLDVAQLLDKEDRVAICEQMRQSTGNFRELQSLVMRTKMKKWLARC